MPDWAAIREEYITGDIGARPLAEKHSVSFNTLKDRMKREGWGEDRRTYRMDMGLPATTRPTPRSSPQGVHHTTPPVVYAPGEQQKENTGRLFAVSEQVLDKIEAMLPGCERIGQVKDLTIALKNIKEIQMIKSALDEREQLARIEKLRAESKEDGKQDNTIEVVFVDSAEGAAR